MREPRWPQAHLLDRQTREQASPGHELPVNEKMLPLTHESNVFPLKMTCGSPPNGWRVSGERRAEGDERVRCTRVLGGSDAADSGYQARCLPSRLIPHRHRPRAE